jgi:ribonuclease HII
MIGAMRYLGFDEAGRGSVLGPLVVGGYLLEEADVDAIREAGGRDSKGMTAARRAAAAEQLRGLGEGWRTVSISAAEIDRGNLNTLEEDAFVRISAELAPDAVQIDAPVAPRGIEAFRLRMAGRFDLPLERVTATPRAENRFPAVGAASVLAKVERDAALERIREQHGAVGSGYPSDPVTRAYLTDLLRRGADLPEFVRTRWDTLNRLREEIEFGTQGSLF